MDAWCSQQVADDALTSCISVAIDNLISCAGLQSGWHQPCETTQLTMCAALHTPKQINYAALPFLHFTFLKNKV